MIAKVALFCLLATVHAKPEPQFPYHINPPLCHVKHDDFELQNCSPVTERVCDTADVKSEVIDYETKCQEVVSRHCPGGVLAAPPAVVPEVEATVSVEKRDADPNVVYHGAPYVHHVAPTTITLKHNCNDVTTKHCAEVPVAKAVVTPVETCHVVTKVACKPTVQKLPRTECDEPAEQVIAGYAHHPYGYGYGFGYGK